MCICKIEIVLEVPRHSVTKCRPHGLKAPRLCLISALLMGLAPEGAGPMQAWRLHRRTSSGRSPRAAPAAAPGPVHTHTARRHILKMGYVDHGARLVSAPLGFAIRGSMRTRRTNDPRAWKSI